MSEIDELRAENTMLRQRIENLVSELNLAQALKKEVEAKQNLAETKHKALLDAVQRAIRL